MKKEESDELNQGLEIQFIEKKKQTNKQTNEDKY